MVLRGIRIAEVRVRFPVSPLIDMEKIDIKAEDNKDIKKTGHLKSFKSGLFDFLKEYSVIGLAIGFVIAQISKDLIDSIVKGLFMPIVNILVPSGELKNMVFYIKGSKFDIGIIINNFLTFTIILILLYLIVKKLIKLENKDNLTKK
jgi:large conductance mechanosensitive channel